MIRKNNDLNKKLAYACKLFDKIKEIFPDAYIRLSIYDEKVDKPIWIFR